MGKSSIEWTDESWNPVTGCSRVSPGCEHCYAEALSLRFKRSKKPWTAQNAAENVVLHRDRLEQPLRWRKPRRVFVNSMSDLFHELVPDDFIDSVFAVMNHAPQHTFQVLTKRPDRMHRYMTQKVSPDGGDPMPRWAMVAVAVPGSTVHWPLSNVWLGVSVEDQRRAAERLPLLLETPAAVRFVSCEPLLGCTSLWDALLRRVGGLDWVIVGGESGPRARPMDVAWARKIILQCRAARVPVFVKQLGRWITGSEEGFLVNTWLLHDGRIWVPGVVGDQPRPANAVAFSLFDRKGGEPSHWPEDLRVREWPT